MHIRQRRGELAISASLLAVAGFFLWGAWRMPAAAHGVPGPGTVPLIVGVLLAATSIALMVKALLARAEGQPALREMRIVPVAIVFAALTGVAIALERVGFIITLSIFLFIMLRAFSPLSILRSALVAVAITVLASWLFVKALGVTLPHW